MMYEVRIARLKIVCAQENSRYTINNLLISIEKVKNNSKIEWVASREEL